VYAGVLEFCLASADCQLCQLLPLTDSRWHDLLAYANKGIHCSAGGVAAAL
jgi:hypothetical protein